MKLMSNMKQDPKDPVSSHIYFAAKLSAVSHGEAPVPQPFAHQVQVVRDIHRFQSKMDYLELGPSPHYPVSPHLLLPGSSALEPFRNYLLELMTRISALRTFMIEKVAPSSRPLQFTALSAFIEKAESMDQELLSWLDLLPVSNEHNVCILKLHLLSCMARTLIRAPIHRLVVRYFEKNAWTPYDTNSVFLHETLSTAEVILHELVETLRGHISKIDPLIRREKGPRKWLFFGLRLKMAPTSSLQN